MKYTIDNRITCRANKIGYNKKIKILGCSPEGDILEGSVGIKKVITVQFLNTSFQLLKTQMFLL